MRVKSLSERSRKHLLDWFHITMRLTVMGQMAKSINTNDQPNLSAEVKKELERLKWNLWHGNVHKALQIVGRSGIRSGHRRPRPRATEVAESRWRIRDLH